MVMWDIVWLMGTNRTTLNLSEMRPTELHKLMFVMLLLYFCNENYSNSVFICVVNTT